MDDRLEKFVKSHRADMDDKSPRKDLWSDIENQISTGAKQRRISKPVIYWRAAAVILLLISSWLVFDKVNQHTTSQRASEMVELNPQLQEAETYYISLIDQKRSEIETVGKKYEFGEGFLYEIDRLDSMYTALKLDMSHGNEENLADAMILNLQLRIEILNQQLSIIKSIENNQRDETIIL